MTTISHTWDNLPIARLIMDGGNFIVYIDHDGDIDWSTFNYNWDIVDLPRFNAAINKAAMLEAPLPRRIEQDVVSHNKRLIAEAIARALDEDLTAAESMLSTVERTFEARYRETSRLWYLTSSLVTAACIVLFGMCLWIFRSWLEQRLGRSGFWCVIGACFGAAGAAFSVIVRSGKLKLEPAAAQKLHYLEGSSRIFAGSIAGGVAFLAVKAGLLLAPLASKENSHAVTCLAAVIAGSAERFASSIVSGVGGQDQAETTIPGTAAETSNPPSPKNNPTTVINPAPKI